jgi:hypothetical protein
MRNRPQPIYERINTGGMIPGVAGTSKRTTLVIAVIVILASAFGVGYFSSPSKTVNQGTVVTQTVTTSSNADAAGTHADAAAAAKAAANAAGNPLKSIWSTETVSQAGVTPTAVNAEDFSSRMVVYTASISLKVDKVESAITSLQQLTEKYKGYVASVSTGAEDGSITIRVPQAAFYDAVAEVETLGKVQSRNINGDDVSEKYVDLQAQLINVKRQEARLQEILGLAKTVAEVLTVEQELARVRGTVESLTGQINYLNSRVEFATITVSLNQTPAKQAAWMPELDLSGPVKTGTQILFTLVEGVITLIVALGPFAVIIAVIYYVYRRVRQARVNSGNQSQV